MSVKTDPVSVVSLSLLIGVCIGAGLDNSIIKIVEYSGGPWKDISEITVEGMILLVIISAVCIFIVLSLKPISKWIVKTFRVKTEAEEPED